MNAGDESRAERLRGSLRAGQLAPQVFRRALLDVSTRERDAWLDRLLELSPPPADGPELPRGCAPYLPCAVDAVLRAMELAEVRPEDVVVDVGSGVGRTAVLVHLLTGASVIGVEIQSHLATSSRELAARLGLSQISIIEGDALERLDQLRAGSVFFLYCPFGRDRLERLLDGIEAMAGARELRVCSVDLPVPPRAWLALISPPGSDCAVYRRAAQAALGF